MLQTLAQSQTPAFVTILINLGIVVALAIAFGIFAFWLRRRFMSQDAPTPSGGFSLSDLRQMHAAGELTDEQFEAIKAKIIARSLPEMGQTPPASDAPAADASDSASDTSDKNPG